MEEKLTDWVPVHKNGTKGTTTGLYYKYVFYTTYHKIDSQGLSTLTFQCQQRAMSRGNRAPAKKTLKF